MRGSVIEHRRTAQRRIDLCGHGVAHLDFALRDLADVRMSVADFLRVAHIETRVRGRQRALVAHLATRFGVERRAVEHHLARFARAQPLDFRTVPDQLADAGLVAEPFIARERGPALDTETIAQIDTELARGARTLALRRHRGFEALLVDRQAALARDIRGQVNWKAIRIVELE